ncbi:MAG: heavy metal translocating P-type ATPase [Lewinellaceae bacterium]|nr:heavy metal translocating P-type ATPase [Lewinellaceae bacterium]
MKDRAVLSVSGQEPPVVHHQCYHCHDTCPDDRLHLEDKFFCCEGCQMVYEILQTNELCQYYTLDENPGITLRDRRDARAYTWLDDEEVRKKLIRFSDGHSARVEFYLPQMHCASCIWLLEHLYRLDKGVLHSKTNFLKKQVTIHFLEEETSLRKLASLLSSIGYAPEINLGDVSGEGAPHPIDRSLYYKIGLAGFAFWQHYAAQFSGVPGAGTCCLVLSCFCYINLLLALPVLLYSAKDYLVSAWSGLKVGHLNIDVPLSLGILMLFGRSAYEILSGTGAGYLDSFAGLIFFLLTGKWFPQKTYHQLSFDRDYKSYFRLPLRLSTTIKQKQPYPYNGLSPATL